MQEVVFGLNANQIYHSFRHTDALGLNRAEVIEAIRQDLQHRLPFPVPPARNVLFVGNVTVCGRELQYRAHPISEGVVNVGRITAA